MSEEQALILRNVELPFTASATVRDVLCVAGRIEAIGVADASWTEGVECEVIDGEGLWAIPGLIDPHIHLGNAAQSFSQDVEVESRVAVAGGVTTMFPYLVSTSEYDEVLGEVDDGLRRSLTDILPQLAIVNEDQIASIPNYYASFGVRHFKCFMGYKGTEVSPSGISGISDPGILGCMRAVAKIPGGRLAIHCENMELIEPLKKQLSESGRQDTRAWSNSRPVVAEYEAIGRAIAFARETSCPVTIPHISFGTDLEHLRAYAAGLDVVFETCPHYLVLSAGDDRGVWGKVNPPLREAPEVEQLWNQLIAGQFDVVGSDHCPFDPETKGDEIWTARAGIPNGMALTLSVLVRAVIDQRITVEELVRLTSTNAAFRYGLGHRKGRLEVGMDADIAVVDPYEEWTFSSDTLGGAATRSPYDGMALQGRAVLTIAGGHLVYHRGRIEPRHGGANRLAARSL